MKSNWLFSDKNLRESWDRKNPGDIFLLAANDIINNEEWTLPVVAKDGGDEVGLEKALRHYDGVWNAAQDYENTYDRLFLWVAKDMLWAYKMSMWPFPNWDGESFREWLIGASEWEQVGALVHSFIMSI